ncbi:GNAT family N-acetyltransferase [Paenibacillus kobensis]|uniref:GNAT family N-acetyltransferase n=1 Tax=Paenibacillus kobensis TaxID=59841 RepID=UPI0013E3BBB0|nr:GNAT family N-acetyltransferase [Paenibacillus kobensis]
MYTNNGVAIQWTTDWVVYGSVHSAAYRSAYRGLMDDHYLNQCTVEQRELYYRSIAADGKGAILSVSGQAAGCLAIGYAQDPNLMDGRKVGEIDAFYLLPEYRGSGYGKQLLAWALDRFNEQNCKCAMLWVLERNTTAIAFYERCGFERDGASRAIERGGRYGQIRMMMEL